MTNWFQTDDCLNFYKSLGFIEAFEFDVKRDNIVKGRIVGYIQKDGGKLKQFFSRRAIINGGPMLAEDITEEEIQVLLSKCKNSLKGKAIYVESRNFKDYSRFKQIFEGCGWKYDPHYNFIIKFNKQADSITRYSQNHRRSIKSSIKNGAIIDECPSIQDIEGFYKCLNNLYREKVKTPLFPYTFFEKLNNIGKIIVVKSADGMVIGGIAMAIQNGEICYEWFVCGDDVNYKKYHPSTLATYAGIRFAEVNNYKLFDFMGAGTPGDGGYGVRDFKAKFGGELVEYGRFKYILNPILYKIGTIGVKLMKRK